MKTRIYNDALLRVQRREQLVSLAQEVVIAEARGMIDFLNALLSELRDAVREDGFTDGREEIDFFKRIKPQLLGKLIYYNKVYRIETACPANRGKLHQTHFASELEDLKLDYRDYVCSSELYRYYKSGRTDMDDQYFKLGNIDFNRGLNSFVFEADLQFSTYYDYKIARIIASDLLYNYLLNRINPDDTETGPGLPGPESKDLYWTDTKSALTELIYALHASRAISNGRLGITKLCVIFQILFQVELGDPHHLLHRMKDRAGSKTLYMDHLKESLEKYMNKSL